ncbi:Low-density lipoprotein receptor domain class A [Cooperia oncophora]
MNYTVFRCSTCSEAMCSDGECLSRRQLCDGNADCTDASDEQGCSGISFRLMDGNEVSGNVQVLFKSVWQPVCQQHIEQIAADKICSSMNMG